MVLLPIVTRELRLAARRKGLYRLRIGAGLLTLGLGAFFLLLRENLTAVSTGMAGRTLFLIVSVLLFGAALLAARLTHDCISEEKRDGTIGLLFLTDLDGHDILLGKLFAGALPSLFGLMSTLPLLASAVLMGGVTGGEVLRTCLALLNLFFFAQSAAIFVSTLSHDRSTAASATVFVVSFFIVGLVMANFFGGRGLWLAEALNPAYTFAVATRIGGVTGSSGEFGLSLATVNVVSWSFLAGASLALPRVWHERREEKRYFRARMDGIKVADENPFYWLVSRRMGNPRLIWGVFGSVIAGEIFAFGGTGFSSRWWVLFCLLVPHALLKFWLACATGRSMEDQRRSGSLEVLLACTALTVKEILDGQRLALGRLFLAPVICLMALDGVAAWFVDDGFTRMAFLGAIISLPIDLLTLRWLATWRAMAQKKPGGAGHGAYFWVCVFPGVFLGLPMLSVGASTNGRTEFFLWLLLGLFIDGILFSTARDKLLVHLRSMADDCGNSRAIGLFQELNITERSLAVRG